MKDKYILGIDTSNYTTSVALVTAVGDVVANIKRPLPVGEGARGLRQSDALFAHTKNLPSAMDELQSVLAGRSISAIGVSSRPRNVEGSYMPCFLVGVAAATSCAAVSGAPLYTFSHQCGHVMAAVHSSGRDRVLQGKPFGAFHVSGGTTELLRVSAVEDGFISEIVGGTKDLNAGQVIDRIGVALGLPFPCGPALEKLALKNKSVIPKRKPSIQGCYANLSGVENLALRLYKETQDKCLVAAFVLDHIGHALLGMTRAYLSDCGEQPIIFAGGVMCNSIIRGILSKELDAAYAEPLLSADNAVGIALLAARRYRQQ